MQEIQETWVQSLGREDPLEQEMEARSSVLAWRIPWTEDSGGLQFMRLQRVRNNLASKQTAAAAQWVHVLLSRFFEVKLEHLASISFSQCWSKIILISHCVCNRVLVSVLKWKGIFLSLSLNSKELLALCYFEKCLFLSLWWADSFSYIIA